MNALTKIVFSVLWFFSILIFLLIPTIFPQVGLVVFWVLLSIPVVMIILVWFNRGARFPDRQVVGWMPVPASACS
jgi:hypothetical protein